MKESRTRFMGNCNICGKEGQRDVDCRNKDDNASKMKWKN